MNKSTLRTVTAAMFSALLLAAGTSAAAATGHGDSGTVTTPGRGLDSALVRGFSAVDRNTTWQLVSRLRLNFPTYHTEGLAIAGDRVFLSAVQIIEPTVNWLYMFQNFHLIHHLFPRIPFYLYPQAFQRLTPVLEKEQAHIYLFGASRHDSMGSFSACRHARRGAEHEPQQQKHYRSR